MDSIDTNFLEEEPTFAPVPKSRWLSRFWNSQKLPVALYFSLAVIVLVEMMLTLIEQGQAYWLSYDVGTDSVLGTSELLQLHPLAFVGAVCGYLVIVWLLSRWLPYRLALPLWVILMVLHIRDGVAWGRCSFVATFKLLAGRCIEVDTTLMVLLASTPVPFHDLSLHLITCGLPYHSDEINLSITPGDIRNAI